MVIASKTFIFIFLQLSVGEHKAAWVYWSDPAFTRL